MSTSPFRLTAIVAGALLAVTVAACGGPAGTGGGAGAWCAGGSRPAGFAAARLVFTGIMLPGPSVGTGQGSVLACPARVRVVRYLKGSGPAVVTVSTAVTRTGGGDVASAEGT